MNEVVEGKLGKPELSWRDDGSPYSGEFEDGYYSDQNGLDETRHVFLKGNNLPDRWKGRKRFVIGETGFGTGLNFLATVDLWLKERPNDATLTYVSAEAYPLSRADLTKALGSWQDLSPLSDQLVKNYPDLSAGYRYVEFPEWGIHLMLLLGDCAQQFSRFIGSIDCWYLDGFAPSRNKSMWSSPVYEHIARCSSDGATLATFTAAGHVRRGLAEVGFRIERVPGYGGKRHMTIGTLREAQRLEQDDRIAPWFRTVSSTSEKTKKIAIVGGGISGTCAAWQLANIGYDVCLIDKNRVGEGASGNRAAVMKPRLTLKPTHESGFFSAAYDYALRFYNQMGNEIVRSCGVFEQAMNEQEADRYRRIVEAEHLSAEAITFIEDASELTNGWSSGSGLYFRDGMVIDGERACQWLADQNGIELFENRFVHTYERVGENWRVIDENGVVICEAEHLLICNGSGIEKFSCPFHFQPQKLGGQVSFVPEDALKPPELVIMAGGYVTPPHVRADGMFSVGASFRKENLDHLVLQDDHRFIRDNLHGLTSWSTSIDVSDWQGRASVRAMSPDRFPIAGPVPDVQYFEDAYSELHHGPHRTKNRWFQFPDAKWETNLYMIGGLGSRGFVSAPLLGVLIANMISGGVMPVPVDQYSALHTARFMVRRLQKAPGHRDQ